MKSNEQRQSKSIIEYIPMILKSYQSTLAWEKSYLSTMSYKPSFRLMDKLIFL